MIDVLTSNDDVVTSADVADVASCDEIARDHREDDTLEKPF